MMFDAIAPILYWIIGAVVLITIIIRPLWGIYLVVFLSSYNIKISGLIIYPAQVLGISLVLAVMWRIYKTKKLPDLNENVTVAIILFFIWLTISYLVSSGGKSQTLFLTRSLSILISYFAMTYLLKTKNQIKTVIVLFVVSGWVDVGYGIIDYIKKKNEILDSGLAQYSNNIQTLYRPTGFSGDPNYLALYLVILIPLTFYLFLTAKSWWQNGFYGLSLVLFSGFTIMTYSRGGFLGLILVLLMLIWRFRHNSLQAGIIILFLTIGSMFVPSQYWKRVATIPGLSFEEKRASDDSIDNRIFYSKLAFNIFLDNPIYGIGIGNFMKEASYTRVAESQVTHNTYLEIAAETGIVGLALFLAVIYFTLHKIRWIRHELKQTQAEKELIFLSEGLELAIWSFAFGSLFLSAQYEKTFWFLVALCVCLRQISKQNEKNRDCSSR